MAEKFSPNFSDSKEWFDFSPEEQEKIIDFDFNDTVAKSDIYKKANKFEKAKLKLAHKQVVQEKAWDSKHNPSIKQRDENQIAANNAGFLKNTFTKAVESHQDAWNRIGIVDDAMNPDGQADSDAGAQLSKVFKKRREHIVTKEQMKLGHDVDVAIKRWEHGDWLEKAKAVGEFISKVPENAGGIVQVGAESLSSMSIMGAGAKTGTEVGGAITAATGGTAAPIIPVTAAIGMIAAEMGDAGSQKLIEGVESELQKRNLKPTPANIQMLLDSNPDWLKAQQEKDIKYGGTLALVDTALGGFFSRISTLATKSARRTAMKTMSNAERAMLKDVARSNGITYKALENDFINGKAAAILKNRSLKKKMGSHVLSYTGEVAGEPISEAAATSAAGEKNDAKNLIYETLGGIGTGPIGASINTAAMGTKLAKNKTGQFTKEALRNKGKLEKAAKAVSNSKNARGFKKEVEETDPSSDLSHLTNPESEHYDPIKAVSILHKSDNEDAYDQAKTIYNDFTKSVIKDMERAEELLEKSKTEGGLSPDEVKEHQDIMAALPHKEKTLAKLSPLVDSLNKKLDNEAQEEIPDVDMVESEPEEAVDAIVKSLGSHGNQNAKTNEDIDTFLSRSDVTEEQKVIPRAIKKYNIAAANLQKKIDTSTKSAGQVHTDIINGDAGSAYKGISAYHRAIKVAMKKGDTKAAMKQVDGLQSFLESHRHKADVMAQMLQAARNNTEASPEIQAQFKELQKKNPNLYIRPESGKLVELVQQEVKTLEAGLALAESLARGKQTQQTPAAPTSTKTEAKPQQQKSKKVSPKAATKKMLSNVKEAIARAKAGDLSWIKKALKSDKIPPLQKKQMQQVLDEVEQQDRRKGDRRKKIADMTIEELRDALLKNELTGIPNRRAYDEADKRKVQTSIDGDSLKWINDNLGHDVGDAMLQGIADILHKVFSEIEGAEAFHVSGDEYIVQGDNEADVLKGLQKVDELLAKQKIKFTLENGDEVILHGLNVTYSLNTEGDLHEADRRLTEEKERKEREGKRAARGEKPANVEIIKKSKNQKGGVSVGDGAARRKMAKSAHDTTWNQKGFDYDKRLHDLRIFELLDGFFQSQATKGKVKNAVIDAGNGMGGSTETVANGSINPDWVKELYKEHKTNYDGVVRAVNKALEARIKPSKKQPGIVTAVIDAALAAMEEAGGTLDQLDQQAIDAWNQEHGVTEETKQSTDDNNTDTVSTQSDAKDNLEQYEDVDLNELEITLDDGSQKPYNEAMAELQEEKEAYEKLKECLSL